MQQDAICLHHVLPALNLGMPSLFDPLKLGESLRQEWKNSRFNGGNGRVQFCLLAFESTLLDYVGKS